MLLSFITEGKTDYYARKRLITQAKNKYNSPKFRLVVRITNRDIICQIVHAKLQGDFVLAAAYSHELPRYGIKHGLTNWAAAYATGLLVARRALVKLGLDQKYAGVEEPEGDLVLTEANEEGPRPFKAFLDVGLRRTSTGARVFGAMKGASDGGIFVPHSENRFPGFDPEGKELDADVLKSYIYGGHVAEYMEALEEEDDEVSPHLWRIFLSFPPPTVADMIPLLSSDSKNNSPATWLMTSAPVIWKKSTPRPTRPSERTRRPSPLTSQSLRNTRRPARAPGRRRLAKSSALPTSRPRSKPTRRVPLHDYSTLLCNCITFMFPRHVRGLPRAFQTSLP